MDPVKGSVMKPLSMVQYLYVKNGPLAFIDTLGHYLVRVMSKYCFTNEIEYILNKKRYNQRRMLNETLYYLLYISNYLLRSL